ncbi:beta-L-arabinofuranosidase domain-containing protein [Allomuricauda sp. NBRC 101325]|uniref:beta-L-arabinofuranosidase domain-containing protein n=1 Tax=Allomuricauda sp. NBRC 101325 TaxID=1113758 RepID=UPI002554F1F5|nr:beta-L-arabinofuranosidase domain-containing protein [Muricauda sp. NBRC 101325]
MKPTKLIIGTFLGCFSFCVYFVQAQEGNQILDGIGETGMISRYILDGDAKDWSRNTLHARIYGSNIKFDESEPFEKVLTLSAENQNYVSIPGEAVEGEESLSISTWVNLKSTEKNQVLFDFGKDGRNHFYLDASGQFHLIKDGQEIYTSQDSHKAIQKDEWTHLALVFDAPSKSIFTYLNGEPIGKIEKVEVELDDLFTHENKLYVGRSIPTADSYLNASIHDFRLYRIPLSEDQIAVIRENALKRNATVAKREKPKDDLPQFDPSVPQLYNQYLVGVSDVEVETTVGVLPRLPRYVLGDYKDGIDGPKVRVQWPAPTNNDEVAQIGTYEVIGKVPGTNFQPKVKVTVIETLALSTPNRSLEVFPLEQVSLNMDAHGHQTKFIENRDKFINTLANTNPDSFLYMFRNAFGQEQPDGAIPLGVWDSQETKLRGHATGHYLTALAQAYASTGYDNTLQSNFKQKMDYMVEVLHQLSRLSGRPTKEGGKSIADPTAVPPGPGKSTFDSDLSENGIRTDYWNWGEGFISAYPPDQFIMLEYGATYGTQPTQIWAPYYTLHKLLAGLMDIYEITGNQKALEIAEGMGNWVYARLNLLPTETLIQMWNTYIAGEFGGMNEAMARLNRITGEPNFLKVAQLFDNIKMFFGDAEHSHGLASNVDTFRGLHANQHIPQILGSLEIYRDSNAPEYYQIADNFWYKARNDYMYSIGGVAGARNPTNAECFVAQPGTLYENGLSSGGQNETCATYNMLKLTKNLFLFDHRTEFMDYYERGLYNHILASVAEDSPANTYHVPLRPGSIKRFGNADMTGFTCCNGTALESSTKLQNSIYFKSLDNNELYVNLFVPSTLEWKEKGITVEQKTAFPKEDHTQLVIGGKGKFDLKVRVPDWASKGVVVKVNGKEEKIETSAGSYISLNRKWKNGDVVDIKMPFQFHLDPIMDQQNIASLFYGPILLVAQEEEARTDWRKITLEANDLGKTIQGDPSTLEFTIDGITFKPFYETYGRHSVYLDVTLK